MSSKDVRQLTVVAETVKSHDQSASPVTDIEHDATAVKKHNTTNKPSKLSKPPKPTELSNARSISE